MKSLEVLKQFNGRNLFISPEINFSNLFKKVLNNFYFEFVNNKEKYSQVMGNTHEELNDFIAENETYLDSLKDFIVNSLFVYSAIVEENSYYLTKPQSIIISRLKHKANFDFEIRFYTHYDDELLNSYDDKIYIGRCFINLERFEQKYLGLENTFLSLGEQNKKIQNRAKQKLKAFDNYKKPYLNEINYLIKETIAEAMNRIKLFPEENYNQTSKIKLTLVLDGLLVIQNLMIELHEFTQEFENKLRQNEENNFVKYLTKFSKDLITDIRYLRKLSSQIHLKISNHSLF